MMTMVAVAYLTSGWRHPSMCWWGVVIGVTVSLLGFRLFAPNEAFPVTYRRGGPRTWMWGARGEAIRRRCGTSLG